MKKTFGLLMLICLQLINAQSYNKEKLLLEYEEYDVILKYVNDFNDDGIMDILFILSSKKENNEDLINNNDSISKRKAIIYLGRNDKTFTKVLDDDNTFPCRECLGKSDNYITDLKFEKNTLSYKTINAPFATNNYPIINFILQFETNNFNINQYKETYFFVESDNNISIVLNNNDLIKAKFSYYDWNANKSWLDNIIISSLNITKINNFAYLLKDVNPSFSIEILLKILEKFPERVVAYLNIADAYWSIGNEDLAKENYIKYVKLMKSQNKDLSKIPKYVLERTK